MTLALTLDDAIRTLDAARPPVPPWADTAWPELAEPIALLDVERGWHVSYRRFRREILRRGLRPTGDVLPSGELVPFADPMWLDPVGVYFFATLRPAVLYGDRIHAHQDDWEVWEANLAGLPVYLDPHWHGGVPRDAIAGEPTGPAIYVPKTIRPKRLRLVRPAETA